MGSMSPHQPPSNVRTHCGWASAENNRPSFLQLSILLSFFLLSLYAFATVILYCGKVPGRHILENFGKKQNLLDSLTLVWYNRITKRKGENKMTVKELIAALSQYDLETEVLVIDPSGYSLDVSTVSKFCYTDGTSDIFLETN